jgi:allantoate deiminase
MRAARIGERLDALFAIGRVDGTNRPGLGPGEQRAFEIVAGWMEQARLDVTVDRAGNLYGRAVGGDPSLPEVWSGSHLDTPPDGGRFDGALGVLAALDAAAAIRAGGGVPRTVTAVAFRMEEGARFGRGCFGSRAVCGMLDDDEADLRDADGVTLGEAFGVLGLGELPDAGWLETPPGYWVETHIEQGPTLAAAGHPLGVVTSIAGMAGVEISFDGRRGHAGTTPMALRSDALAAGAAFVVAAHDAARSIPEAVCTIGRLTVSPGATNTIPGHVELFADLRAPDAERLEALLNMAEMAASLAAQDAGCDVTFAPSWRYEPVPMSREPAAAIRDAIAGLGLEPFELPSGAGHDAAIMGMAGVPSAMLFVRSDAGGISHAPQEHTEPDAIEWCVRALEPALRELAGA